MLSFRHKREQEAKERETAALAAVSPVSSAPEPVQTKAAPKKRRTPRKNADGHVKRDG